MKHQINVLFLLIGVGSVLLFFRESEYVRLYLTGIVALFFLVMSIGVIWLGANYFLYAVHKVRPPFVLLTFDDGPDPETTPAIIRSLNQHGVKALFFVVGEKAEKHPELLRQIKDEGHLIGNHTYSHPYLFALLPGRRVREEIERGNTLIGRITGERTVWFRPPIGYTNPIIARAIRSFELTVIGWNKRSYDTVIKDPVRLGDRMLRLTKPGDILLLHDNLPQTEKMLSTYIERAKNNGIIFADEGCINSLLK